MSSIKNQVGASDATNMVIFRRIVLWRRRTASQVMMTVRKMSVAGRGERRCQSARDVALSQRKNPHPREATVATVIRVEELRRAGRRAARDLSDLRGPGRVVGTKKREIEKIGIEEGIEIDVETRENIAGGVDRVKADRDA